MFENITFNSKRLKTQPLNKSDAETLFRIYSDREAMKFRGNQPLKTIEDAYHMIASQLVGDNQTSKLRLGIREKSNNQLIGTLLLIKDKNQCEIGFSFGKDYWNRGFGKETLEMIETQLKTQKDIKILKAWCIKENFASIKIFKNAGFSEVKQNEYPQSHLFIKEIK